MNHADEQSLGSMASFWCKSAGFAEVIENDGGVIKVSAETGWSFKRVEGLGFNTNRKNTRLHKIDAEEFT